MTRKLLIMTALLTFSAQVFAHPVAFKGSYSIMTWNSKDMSDWMLTYSMTAKTSVTARYLRFDERDFYLPQASLLVKRWNELDSQANIYLSAGQGVEKVGNGTKSATLAALETDWESRKYYVSFKETALLNNRQNIFETKARIGFAPYLAKFEEINSWFILEALYVDQAHNEFELIPYVRFFYHNVLTEFGVSAKGSAQFNFMVHF